MSANLTTPSPLMLTVLWQGQEYFTSQYFHQQYLANSQNTAGATAKYQWHQDFVRLMKSIEAYNLYKAQGNILELRWVSKRNQGSADPAYLQQIKMLEPLFAGVGFQTLYLLDAVGQIAMAQQLDDTISQQLSVATNTSAARQLTRKAVGSLTAVEHAARELEAFLKIGQLLQTPLHITQQEAAKQIAVTTGVNLRPLLVAAPAQDAIPAEDQMLEPADLAKRLGATSGASLNKALEAIGWQVKRIGGGWEPTPAGMPFAADHAWTTERGSKSGYNLKWNIQAVADALRAAGYPITTPKEA